VTVDRLASRRALLETLDDDAAGRKSLAATLSKQRKGVFRGVPQTKSAFDIREES
jgi:hypothetical protein